MGHLFPQRGIFVSNATFAPTVSLATKTPDAPNLPPAPLVVILKNDRKKYYRVLERADPGNFQPLLLFMAQSAERSLDIYLKVLTPSNKGGERIMPLSEASKGTPYSMEYLSLLIRRGKLEGYKNGRDWMVSKEAVERYIASRKRKRAIRAKK